MSEDQESGPRTDTIDPASVSESLSTLTLLLVHMIAHAGNETVFKEKKTKFKQVWDHLLSIEERPVDDDDMRALNILATNYVALPQEMKDALNLAPDTTPDRMWERLNATVPGEILGADFDTDSEGAPTVLMERPAGAEDETREMRRPDLGDDAPADLEDSNPGPK